MIIDINKENNKVKITDNDGNIVNLTYGESVAILEGIIKNIVKDII